MATIFQDGRHFWCRKHIFYHRISLTAPIWMILVLNRMFSTMGKSNLQLKNFFRASLCRFWQRMWENKYRKHKIQDNCSKTFIVNGVSIQNESLSHLYVLDIKLTNMIIILSTLILPHNTKGKMQCPHHRHHQPNITR